MHSILKQIVENKKNEVEQAKLKVSVEQLKKKALTVHEPRDFYSAVTGKKSVNIIAEIKKASPSKGVLREVFDPKTIAKEYSHAGAKAISVLTEEKYFHGWIEYLKTVKNNSKVPVLRKDFIIDEYQVYESRCYNADAMLLIAAILDAKHLAEMVDLTESLNMSCLLEVHDQKDLEKALKTNARIIGINNRDLTTFHVDKKRAKSLLAQIPKDKVIVIESGIENREDIEMYLENGINTFLIGELLMKSENPGNKIRELIGE